MNDFKSIEEYILLKRLDTRMRNDGDWLVDSFTVNTVPHKYIEATNDFSTSKGKKWLKGQWRIVKE